MNAYELADELQELDAKLHLIVLFKSADMLRQQADRIAELEKDLALKTRDRDVFSNFTLAYEKRIEELEKELDTVDKAYKWMDETYKGTLAKLEQAQSVLKELGWHEINKDGYAKLQTKPLSDEEIISMFEHPDDFNCIDFARAIEERHGIK